MLVPAPPPDDLPIYALSAAQQADLDCLSAARALASQTSKVAPKAQRMVRVFSERLRRSDPKRDWLSLAAPKAVVTYGAFMSSMATCPRRLFNHPPPPESPVSDIWAAVQLRAHDRDFSARIESGPIGYRFIVECLRGCIPPARYVQEIGDTPISLFRLSDEGDFIYSLWGGGSAYRVRVWSVEPHGVTELLAASTRSWPEFLWSAEGSQQVRINEAGDGAAPPRLAIWEVHDGRLWKLEGESRGK